jgi:hypothetical protein
LDEWNLAQPWLEFIGVPPGRERKGQAYQAHPSENVFLLADDDPVAYEVSGRSYWRLQKAARPAEAIEPEPEWNGDISDDEGFSF